MMMSGTTVGIGLGAIGIIPVAFLVWVIGLALGGPTGYAINPARDLGPRYHPRYPSHPGQGRLGLGLFLDPGGRSHHRRRSSLQSYGWRSPVSYPPKQYSQLTPTRLVFVE